LQLIIHKSRKVQNNYKNALLSKTEHRDRLTLLYVLWFTLPNITKKTNNVDLPKTTQEFKDSTARIPGQAERIRGHL
jgi:hypothetical protein